MLLDKNTNFIKFTKNSEFFTFNYLEEIEEKFDLDNHRVFYKHKKNKTIRIYFKRLLWTEEYLGWVYFPFIYKNIKIQLDEYKNYE